MRSFIVSGMNCAACSARVEKAVSSVPGVTLCEVNLLTGTMKVEGTAPEKAIINSVINAGYGIKKSNGQVLSNTMEDNTKKLKRILLFSLAFLLPEMYLSMGVMMWNWPIFSAFNNDLLCWSVICLLTVIVMTINIRFFINGIKGIVHLSPNMDSLVATGSLASFLYSFVWLVISFSEGKILSKNNFFFDSAAMILVLITVGKILESKSKGKATNALKGLIDLAPQKAITIQNNQEIEVDAKTLKVGDIFLAKPGMGIPVDGIILEGGSAVDESMLTGESIPINKSIDDFVSAGTLNLDGFIKCKATKVGEDTSLSRIIKLVSDSAASKAPIARIADKISGIFVPIVFSIAIITFVIWLLLTDDIGISLTHGISVLVVSCPCALGLATPVAIMVGNGIAAKSGILFKTSTALEQTGKISVVAIDKTGTITEGKPVVTDIITDNDVSKEEILQIAASLERGSQHPFAEAIISGSNGIKQLEVKNFISITSKGVKGKINGLDATCGNVELAEVSSEFISVGKELAENGKTPLYVTLNKNTLGVIGVSDVERKDSKEAINQLEKMGIETFMLTGDNEQVAKRIAERVGIKNVFSGLKPEEKALTIKSLKSKGPVLMIGDGINDAPSLTAANIGMAIGAGTDIAIDAADIVIMNNSLLDAVAAIRLSRFVIRDIYENFFWAFCYNLIGIPLAAGVFIPINGVYLTPMFGAAAMSFSSLVVVLNALRLNIKDIHNSKSDKLFYFKEKYEENSMTKTITIEGMMCTHCSGRVQKVLESMNDVNIAEVSHETGIAHVELKNNISNDILKEAIEKEGYKVVDIK